jgi:hypothetical protein
MRYILMTFVAPERVRWWEEEATAEERKAHVDDVMAWFAAYGEKGWLAGGAELGSAPQAKTVRRRGVTDGPFAETKEVLGGFIVVDVPTHADAMEMASRWPGLIHDGDAVEVRPEGTTGSEA